jgi:hypothetical protein
MPPEILLNAMRSVIHRCQQCLEQNGAQFEQSKKLYCYFYCSNAINE